MEFDRKSCEKGGLVILLNEGVARNEHNPFLQLGQAHHLRWQRVYTPSVRRGPLGTREVGDWLANYIARQGVPRATVRS